MGLSVFPAPSTSVATGTQTFLTSGTWTAPSGVTSVNCVLVGGGGGGGMSGNHNTNANQSFPAGGGAGGQVVRSRLAVTPGTTYAVTVGAGGAGGVATNTTENNHPAFFGGHSSIGLGFTTENAIIYGAVEDSVNHTFFGGENGSYSLSGYPTTFSEYNGGQGSGRVAWSSSTSVATISGVSVGSTTRLYIDQNNNNGYRDIGTWVRVQPDTTYSFSGYVGSWNGNSFQAQIAIDYYTGFSTGRISGTNSGATSIGTSSSTWTRLSMSTTSPSNAVWAWVRFQASGPQPRWTGLMLRTGSLTNYVGTNSSSISTIWGLGVINVTSGLVAQGGGGGWGVINGIGTTPYEVPYGFGGGHFGNIGTLAGIGGNGASAGDVNTVSLFSSNGSTPYFDTIRNPQNGSRTIKSGNPGLRINSANAGLIIQPNTVASPEGYGAGGMGAFASASTGTVLTGIPGVGAGPSISNTNTPFAGAPNTGAGGGGANGSNGTTPLYYSGAAGGSGIVVLNW